MTVTRVDTEGRGFRVSALGSGRSDAGRWLGKSHAIASIVPAYIRV